MLRVDRLAEVPRELGLQGRADLLKPALDPGDGEHWRSRALSVPVVIGLPDVVALRGVVTTGVE